jgi:hypothetical protein
VVLLHDPTSYGSRDQACDRATGRRTALDFPLSVLVGGGQPDHVAAHSLVIVGHRIAYAWDDNDGLSGYSGVSVANARSGAQRYPAFVTGGHYTRFRRLVLTRTGSLAWSEKGKVGYVKTCTAKCMVSNTGIAKRTRTIAQGRTVDPESLRGISRGISWREAGRVRRVAFA